MGFGLAAAADGTDAGCCEHRPVFPSSTKHGGECCFANLPEVKRLGTPVNLKAMTPQRRLAAGPYGGFGYG